RPAAAALLGSVGTHLAHRSKRRHRCSVCGREFSRPSRLVDHMTAHTGEKPYSCSLCSKRFTKKINVAVHQRVHTGEKPYSCPDCGVSYAQPASAHRRPAVSVPHLSQDLQAAQLAQRAPADALGRPLPVPAVQQELQPRPRAHLPRGRALGGSAVLLRHLPEEPERSPSLQEAHEEARAAASRAEGGRDLLDQ
uniref:C2H2-type domain-containing protein n=1 Tax=Maylandia zebra TaxID=106582 RepID=A0A3P9CMX1_9CICH